MFEKLFEKFNKFYENLFCKYGLFISKYYIFTIVFAFLLNLFLSFGLLKIKLLTDSDELYSVSGSQAKADEKLLKSLFATDDYFDNFYLYQLIDFGTWAEINFHVKSEIDDKNIINKTYFNEIKNLNNLILKNVTATHGQNKTYKFKDLCAKRFGQCAIDGIDLLSDNFFIWLKTQAFKIQDREAKTSHANANLTTKKQQKQSKNYLDQDTLYVNPPSLTDLKFILGKHFKFSTTVNKTSVEANNSKEYGYATIFKIRYSLRSNYDNASDEIKKWEFEFLNFMKNVKLDYLTITYSTSQSLEAEMLDNISFDIYLISTTFTLITLFAILFMSFKSNLITSPGIILPCSGILSATFACTSSIGLISIFNYPACNLIFVIPFLVLGIGIDDMFIMYSSFMHTNPESSTSDRISMALKHSGVSITITSLTDFVAFLVGISAGFKSVQIFCLYAAFAILFCYFYQLTFFCGWMVIHSNRIQSQRNTFIWCIQHKNNLDDDEQQQQQQQQQQNIELNKVDGNGQNIITKEQNNQQEIQEIKKVNNNRRNKKQNVIIKKLLNLYYVLEKNWNKLYKILLYRKIGKLIVLVIFLIYITLFTWSASKIREGIELGDLVADNSYFRAYIQDNLASIDILPVVMLAIYKPIDYTNKSIQSRIGFLINEAKNIDGISKDFEFNWMRMYESNLKTYKKTNKTKALLEIKENSLPFRNDVVIQFNNLTQNHEIVASRFFLQYDYLKFNSEDAKPMNKLRDLCKNSNLPILAYAFTFKFYEQFEQTLPNIIQAFVIALEAMYIISLIFIPDLISTLCIISSMISIMVGLVGCMHLWNLTLSSITMLQLVMSVGFCVDFSAHLTHAFIASTGKGTRNERAHKACMRTGLPIFNSALSTIIGVCVLGFCKSYIFISFFKTMFIVMSLGVLNSMLFLPVLLSIVGPHWSRHKEIASNKVNNTSNGKKSDS